MNADNIKWFIQYGDHRDLEPLLLACMSSANESGLEQITLLFEQTDIGGPPDFEGTVTGTAALAHLHWGQSGLVALSRAARQAEKVRQVESAGIILAHAAAERLPDLSALYEFRSVPNLLATLELSSERFSTANFLISARTEFARLISTLMADRFNAAKLYNLLVHLALRSGSGEDQAVYNMFMGMLGANWLSELDDILQQYDTLIEADNTSEEDVHKFLATHKQILEPFQANVWSKARLGENLVADFVIQLMDESYVVVEIEKPSDKILNRQGNLTARATHAIRQALEYRDWLVSNQLYASKNLPGLWRPTALVVIGIEEDLSTNERVRLRQENESRNGIVTIVGFDRLAKRSRTIMNNLILQKSGPL